MSEVESFEERLVYVFGHVLEPQAFVDHIERGAPYGVPSLKGLCKRKLWDLGFSWDPSLPQELNDLLASGPWGVEYRKETCRGITAENKRVCMDQKDYGLFEKRVNALINNRAGEEIAKSVQFYVFCNVYEGKHCIVVFVLGLKPLWMDDVYNGEFRILCPGSKKASADDLHKLNVAMWCLGVPIYEKPETVVVLASCSE